MQYWRLLLSVAREVIHGSILHGNEIYMRHIQLLETKIYFGVISIHVKYISNICQIYLGKYIYKIYVKYILNIQLMEKIYFIHFDTYLTYIFVLFFSMWDEPWKMVLEDVTNGRATHESRLPQPWLSLLRANTAWGNGACTRDDFSVYIFMVSLVPRFGDKFIMKCVMKTKPCVYILNSF